MRKIVVTGALGHIGSKLIRDIGMFFPDVQVLMIDNLRTNRYCSLFDLPDNVSYRFVEGDVLSLDMEGLFAEADVVIHLAAITEAANSFKIKDEVEKVNYHGTMRVAEACLRTDCPLIHMSSTSIYGTQSEVVDEDCPVEDLKPQSPYAETKLKEEMFLASLSVSQGLRFVILRNGTICGTSPGMRFHTAVNKFCWQAVTGVPVSVWTTAMHQRRPYLCLVDCVNAIMFLIKKRLFDGKIYNVVTDNLTVNDIIESIKRYVPGLKIEYVDSPVMNQLSYVVSGDRFRSLGFSFHGRPSDEIRNTIALLRGVGGGTVEKLI